MLANVKDWIASSQKALLAMTAPRNNRPPLPLSRVQFEILEKAKTMFFDIKKSLL